MASGLETTFRLLKETANEAAIPVLLCALDSRQRSVQESALDVLLQRHSPVAEEEMLNRWPKLSPRWKQRIAERNGWISAAAKNAVRRSTDQLFVHACDAAILTRDHDLIPLLAAAASDTHHPHADQAADTVLQLAEILYEETTSPRDYRVRRDPQLQRSHVLPGLEKAIDSFHQHGRRELIEAFCLLTQRDNAVLKRILQSPSERSFQPLGEVLVQSSRPGIVRLLLSYLEDPHAPLAALQLMARRRDVSFLRQLFRRIGEGPSATIRGNLKRIDSVQWFKGSLAILDALSETEQTGAVQFAALSSVGPAQACDVLAYCLRHGHIVGRRAASAALSSIEGAIATDLAIRGLRDSDTQVRANMLAQLRTRQVPNAIALLLEALDSPHAAERDAAQRSLEEFNFARFVAAFDTMSPQARKSTGELVRKVDQQALPAVRQELQAPSRSRQRRALEVAVAMGAVAEVQNAILPLLSDDDQFLRIDAIRALSGVDTPEIRMALRQALLDHQPLVHEAAELALAEIARIPVPAHAASAAEQPSRDTVSLSQPVTQTTSVAEVRNMAESSTADMAESVSCTPIDFDLQAAIEDAMATLNSSRPMTDPQHGGKGAS